MPQDREAYRMGREAINKEAEHRYNASFLALPHREQDLVLKAIHDGKPEASADIWQSMSVAWDEIGFGGPAYPRAYTRLERGEPEPWEVEERRYDWLAPEDSVSHEVKSAAHHHTEADQHKS